MFNLTVDNKTALATLTCDFDITQALQLLDQSIASGTDDAEAHAELLSNILSAATSLLSRQAQASSNSPQAYADKLAAFQAEQAKAQALTPAVDLSAVISDSKAKKGP